MYAGLIIELACVLLLVLLWQRLKASGQRTVNNATQEARRIVAQAEIEAQSLLKDSEVAARERLLAARSEFERETRDYRIDLSNIEDRLKALQETLDERDETMRQQSEQLAATQADVATRESALIEREQQLEALCQEQQARLEQVAGMTAEQAKDVLLHNLENEARMDAAAMVRRIEEEAIEKSKEKARRIISASIQRIASDHVIESTVSVVDLPSDDMKGRIIGREGRNIRAFEQASGVDLIVDDTPGAVILSCFEPVRREIARLALIRLIQDGRIHPARIEEIVGKVQAEMEEKLLADGEAAALEMSIPDLHPDLLRMVGRLQFRSSYGQNVLKHSKEVAWLACHMATELGANSGVAKRAGFLHDIGKAVDREMEGTHLDLGREFLRKLGEQPDVIHAMECHHGDYDPTSVEAVLVTAADALSAARPGARREILENYIKRLEKLETVANEFDGVEKAFAIQAGRELRIIVEASQIGDDAATWLARDVAKKIEGELTYPGQIKVTVIRETRAVEYAR